MEVSLMSKLTMNTKILMMTFFIIAISFFIGGLLLLSTFIGDQEQKFGDKGMLVARTVSNMPEIQNALKLQSKDEAIQKINSIVEEVRIINKARYIVVMDLERVKYSHPVKSHLGEKSTSEDLNAAFSEHYYISKAAGVDGTMVRAFVPILDETKTQIGVVVVAYPLPTMVEMIEQYKQEAFVVVIITVLFSLLGAYSLGQNIKKQMFGLEPVEISKLYMERQETFNAMYEGVIAVDQYLKITIFNEQAARILGVDGNPSNYLGKNIYDVLPDTRLPEIVERNKPVYNQELFVNNHSILSNRIPITVDGKIAGAVAIFKDLTEVKNLAEELTGVKAFVQALRVQTHEHKNKLHTITGLLQLGHTERALEYLKAISASEDALTKFLHERFSNENISGLLLSKVSRGKELGITVEIDQESSLTRLPKTIDHHDMVILFGNLIENAFDALQQSLQEEKYVTISVDDHDGTLAILVSDNGVGMNKDVQRSIFNQGFSTKQGEYRGIGLYLINEIVKKGNGTIEVTSKEGEGTTFVILFELGDEE